MLFRSLFRDDDEAKGRYPRSRIDAAIERAVDGTDSRLRLLSGYRKRLLEPVVAALDHAVALVDALSEPLVATRERYPEEHRLAAVFASSESMLEQLGRDLTLRNFLAGPGRYANEVTTLLRAEKIEKHILGRDLVDGQMRRDVPQIAVSFAGHHIVDPSENEVETRCLLKQRAFDQVVTLALSRIASAQEKRADLARQRDLLRRKLAALERGDLSFDPPQAGFPDQRSLVSELERITRQLHRLGTEDKVLRVHLDMVAEVLMDAARQLWSRDISLHLDAMNIQRQPRDPSARRIILRELHTAQGRPTILLLLRLAPSDLPPPEDFLTAAERYLRR
ncbi:hypothetical protein [Thiorhodococcus minor]|uniref:Uncharacterized protein n=1 Tax=Thiorhodococcus minor TaxID=57489 RepID=A0A6M0K3W2_9GAMM|nr:hypothetical protein [Thiorhodococcus minor]NEV64099.1 hypothetical protein [Thiorhodococcus minor]